MKTTKEQSREMADKISQIGSCDNAQANHRLGRLQEEGIIAILEQLLEDKARLDWLNKSHRVETFISLCGEKDIRQALDSAMKEEDHPTASAK